MFLPYIPAGTAQGRREMMEEKTDEKSVAGQENRNKEERM